MILTIDSKLAVPRAKAETRNDAFVVLSDVIQKTFGDIGSIEIKQRETARARNKPRMLQAQIEIPYDESLSAATLRRVFTDELTAAGLNAEYCSRKQNRVRYSARSIFACIEPAPDRLKTSTFNLV